MTLSNGSLTWFFIFVGILMKMFEVINVCVCENVKTSVWYEREVNVTYLRSVSTVFGCEG